MPHLIVTYYITMTNVSSLLLISHSLLIKMHASVQSRNMTANSNICHQKYIEATRATGSKSGGRIKASPSSSPDYFCISTARTNNWKTVGVIIYNYSPVAVLCLFFFAFRLSASNQHTHLQTHSCLLRSDCENRTDNNELSEHKSRLFTIDVQKI